MRKTKYILSALFALIIMVSSLIPLTVYAESSNDSLGYRTISYQISSSDLENYADGGRSGLDISLRSSIPQGVTYSFETEERQVTLTLRFEFKSAKDYREKVIGLCGTDTAVICSLDNEVLLVESAAAMNYLDFLFEVESDIDVENSENSEESQKQTSTFDIRSMMTVTKNVLFVDDTEYQIEDTVNIRPEISDEDFIRADYLSLHTEGKRNGNFKRTVVVGISDDANEEKKDYFNKLFKKLGKVKTEQISENEITLQVTFEAYGQQELAAKTEQCLGCNIIQIENLYPIDKKNIGVTNQEFYDLTAILNPEGLFSYTFDVPSYYSNIQTVEGYSYTTESGIASENEIITYSYAKKFCFDEICISTDISNWFGKIDRTIRLSVSNEIADFYHENIKTQLSERLPKDSVMTISEDENGIYYEIGFSSYSTEKVLEFTNAILDSSGELTIDRGFLGISNQISENISVDNVLTSMSPARSVSSNYTLISTASLADEMEEYDESCKMEDGVVDWNICGTENICIMYGGVNIISVILFVSITLVIGCVAVVIIKKVKKINN